MKKLLVLALTVVMVLAFSALTMAEATFSGEIDVAYQSTTPDGGDTASNDYAFGKMVLSGKLGDDLTGCLVFKADPAKGALATDEADVTFTKDFGTLKFGYYGWNNNPKDIVDSYRGDVKSQFTSSTAIKVADAITVGFAYAYMGTTPNDAVTGKGAEAIDALYGLDFGYATDLFGVDVLLTNTADNTKMVNKDGDNCTTTGVQGWYKMDAFKVYLQYETVSDAYVAGIALKDDPTNTIVGFTYEPADGPFYARVEYDASADNDATNQTGVRVGYKLVDGAKIEFQNFVNKANTSASYVKLICAF